MSVFGEGLNPPGGRVEPLFDILWHRQEAVLGHITLVHKYYYYYYYDTYKKTTNSTADISNKELLDSFMSHVLSKH